MASSFLVSSGRSSGVSCGNLSRFRGGGVTARASKPYWIALSRPHGAPNARSQPGTSEVPLAHLGNRPQRSLDEPGLSPTKSRVSRRIRVRNHLASLAVCARHGRPPAWCAPLLFYRPQPEKRFMKDQIRKELRLLRLYVVFSVPVLGVLLFAALAKRADPPYFEEITVERINVVEPDGRKKLVIASSARQTEGMMGGVEVPLDRTRPAGLIYFNDHGDEVGGLIFGGDRTEGAQSLT